MPHPDYRCPSRNSARGRPVARRTVLFAAGASAIGLTGACTTGRDTASPTASHSTGDAEAPSLRPRFHLTPPSGWAGDPQRPYLREGTWFFHHLHHDAPAPGPTAWALTTSTDLVAFTAAESPAIASEDGMDVWSGSAVVDAHGIAGQGAGAVLALATRPTDGRSEQQEQYLHVSEDGGASFALLPEPVIRNDAARTASSEAERADASWFRDPRLVRDDEHAQWACAIGRAGRTALFTSPDLRTWTEAASFEPLLDDAHPDLGGMECPDLFAMRAGDGSLRWILGASLDGTAAGAPTGFGYWVGTWDGHAFTPEDPAPQWLDNGWDWYAAVTWPSAEEPESLRHAIGWLNSWAYAREPSPTVESDGYDGQYSIVRDLLLITDDDDSFRLVSTPTAALAGRAAHERTLPDRAVDGSAELDDAGRAYELELELTPDDAGTTVGVAVGRSADGTGGATIGRAPDGLFVDRGPSPGAEAFGERSRALTPLDPAARSVRLRILVDTQSLEVFADDGRIALSQQVRFAPDARGSPCSARTGPAGLAASSSASTDAHVH